MRHTEILKELDIAGVGQAAAAPTQDISDREGDERRRQQKERGFGYNIFVADFMDKVRKMLDAKLQEQPPGGGAPAPTPPPTGGTEPAPTPPPTGGTEPAPTPPPTGGTAPGPAGRPQQPVIDQQMGAITSQMRNLQSTAGKKPVPPTSKIAKEIAADMDKVALNKDYFVNTGTRILKLANAGYDVTNYHKQFMAQALKGKKDATIQEQRLAFIYLKLLNETSILAELRQAGYNPVHIFKVVSKKLNETRSFIQATDILLESYPYDVNELLMEVGFIQGAKNLLGIAPKNLPTTRVQPGQPGVGTWPPEKIEEYLLANLPRVLRLDQTAWGKGLTQRVQGANGTKSMADLIKDLSKEYAQDRGAKTLPQLAQAAYAISQVSPEEQAQARYGGASGGGTAAAGAAGAGAAGAGAAGAGAAGAGAAGAGAARLGSVDEIVRNAERRPGEAAAAITKILGSMNEYERSDLIRKLTGSR